MNETIKSGNVTQTTFETKMSSVIDTIGDCQFKNLIFNSNLKSKNKNGPMFWFLGGATTYTQIDSTNDNLAKLSFTSSLADHFYYDLSFNLVPGQTYTFLVSYRAEQDVNLNISEMSNLTTAINTTVPTSTSTTIFSTSFTVGALLDANSYRVRFSNMTASNNSVWVESIALVKGDIASIGINSDNNFLRSIRHYNNIWQMTNDGQKYVNIVTGAEYDIHTDPVLKEVIETIGYNLFKATPVGSPTIKTYPDGVTTMNYYDNGTGEGAMQFSIESVPTDMSLLPTDGTEILTGLLVLDEINDSTDNDLVAATRGYVLENSGLVLIGSTNPTFDGILHSNVLCYNTTDKRLYLGVSGIGWTEYAFLNGNSYQVLEPYVNTDTLSNPRYVKSFTTNTQYPAGTYVDWKVVSPTPYLHRNTDMLVSTDTYTKGTTTPIVLQKPRPTAGTINYLSDDTAWVLNSSDGAGYAVSYRRIFTNPIVTYSGTDLQSVPKYIDFNFIFNYTTTFDMSSFILFNLPNIDGTSSFKIRPYRIDATTYSLYFDDGVSNPYAIIPNLTRGSLYYMRIEMLFPTFNIIVREINNTTLVSSAASIKTYSTNSFGYSINSNEISSKYTPLSVSYSITQTTAYTSGAAESDFYYRPRGAAGSGISAYRKYVRIEIYIDSVLSASSNPLTLSDVSSAWGSLASQLHALPGITATTNLSNYPYLNMIVSREDGSPMTITVLEYSMSNPAPIDESGYAVPPVLISPNHYTVSTNTFSAPTTTVSIKNLRYSTLPLTLTNIPTLAEDITFTSAGILAPPTSSYITDYANAVPCVKINDDGIIEQKFIIGPVHIAPDITTVYRFPKAFATKCFNVQITPHNTPYLNSSEKNLFLVKDININGFSLVWQNIATNVVNTGSADQYYIEVEAIGI